MVKAILNGIVIAETNEYEVVEGSKYFPPESIKKEYFSASETQCVGSFILETQKRSTDYFLQYYLPSEGVISTSLR
jgi:hypothetical protein